MGTGGLSCSSPIASSKASFADSLSTMEFGTERRRIVIRRSHPSRHFAQAPSAPLPQDHGWRISSTCQAKCRSRLKRVTWYVPVHLDCVPTSDCLIRDPDYLSRGLDCFTRGLDCLAQGLDCLAQGLDCLKRGLDCLARGAARLT